MKWQRIAIITFVILMLVAPISAYVGNSSSYQIRGVFGGSGFVNNTTNYQARQVVTNQQPTWFTSTSLRNFISGIYPFGISCFSPTNNTEYTIGTDIIDKDILICEDTYYNVSFINNLTNVSFDCRYSNFIGDGTNPFLTINNNGFNLTNCNITNYTYGVYTTANSGLYHNNMFWNNTIEDAYDSGSGNSWNASKDCLSGFNIIGGLCRGGNYWGNYTGIDENFDGIGDTELPYIISQNGQDNLPLTNLNELPDAGFLAISFIIGLFSIAFILAYLSTTIGVRKQTNFVQYSNGMHMPINEGMGGLDLRDSKDYNHWPLRMYFLMLSLLTIVADLHIIAALERDYISSLGDLTNSLIDKLPYAILLVPIFYLVVTLLYRIFKHMKEQKEQKLRY